MVAEHRLPLLAFLVLSGLCLVVAAAGLIAPATVVPGVPHVSVLADAPDHVPGEVLQGRTSVPVPGPGRDQIVPAGVLGDGGSAAPEVSVAEPAVYTAPATTRPAARPAAASTTRHIRQNTTRHHRARHAVTRTVSAPTTSTYAKPPGRGSAPPPASRGRGKGGHAAPPGRPRATSASTGHRTGHQPRHRGWTAVRIHPHSQHGHHRGHVNQPGNQHGQHRGWAHRPPHALRHR